MSNFAERLVARSTGQAAASGVALLTPRPASRFEPSGGPGDSSESALEGLEAVIPEALLSSPGADAAPDGAEVRDGAAFASRADRRRSMPAATYASDPREAVISPPERKNRLPTAARDGHVRAASPDKAGLTASTPVPEREARGSGESVASDDSIKGIERDVVRPAWIDPARVELASVELATGSTARDRIVPEARSVTPAERSEPAISIGRIEVQFLPRELPASPPPAQPPRTRGFQAYARARRGQR